MFSEAGWDGYPNEYEITLFVPAGVAPLARAQWAIYRDLCAPMEDADLARALLRLREMTIRKAEEGSDWQFTMDCWLDELQHYPADIVLWAIDFWKKCERFWPSWAEFKALLDRRVSQRRACMDALRQIGERSGSMASAAE